MLSAAKQRWVLLLALCGACEVDGPGKTVRVAWSINGASEEGRCLTLDTCSDVGAESVQVRIMRVDTGEVTANGQWPCDPGSATYGGLAAGDYEISMTLLSAAQEPLTDERTLTRTFGSDVGTEVCITFPSAAFNQPYEGSYSVTLSWAGRTCRQANVSTRVINGESAPCTPKPETLESTDWGPWMFEVLGLHEDGRTCYEGMFEVIVGAGENPAIPQDVPEAVPSCQ